MFVKNSKSGNWRWDGLRPGGNGERMAREKKKGNKKATEKAKTEKNVC